jgi:hypothetical protein
MESFLVQEFIAKAITLPAESELMDLMEVADPDAVHEVRRFVIKQIASSLRQELLNAVCTGYFVIVFIFYPFSFHVNWMLCRGCDY